MLDEEKETDERLTDIAASINVEAREEEEPGEKRGTSRPGKNARAK